MTTDQPAVLATARDAATYYLSGDGYSLTPPDGAPEAAEAPANAVRAPDPDPTPTETPPPADAPAPDSTEE
ncbi:hypothetical protein [Nitrospirillum bahiense]|uniref:Uncharacterized protein n=1 Tax=Nitrospirillum amazonense TaxID=28077 RepID=A0A560F1V1_9PROT|nr:hypothetical protein [Nitrospirillum amazonense]TWB15598.1 hypothetical protein FBZ88_12951 [Nitrospirillum amazonense]